MTKLITVTSIRDGVGKTTVSSILAEKLSIKHRVCLIDDNRSDINIYSIKAPVENINLYSCIADKESCNRAIMESAAELKKNLYFFSGGNEMLTEEEIQFLKEQNIFEYIILDTAREIKYELYDFNVTVINPNNYEYKMVKQAKQEKDIIIVNRNIDNSEFKVNKQDLKLYFCLEIINFNNGYELTLSEENEIEMKKLIERITGKKVGIKTKGKFKLFGRS